MDGAVYIWPLMNTTATENFVLLPLLALGKPALWSTFYTIPLYLAVSRDIPLYPAVSRCIPLYPAVSRCIPVLYLSYPAISRYITLCIPLYPAICPICPVSPRNIWGPEIIKNILQSTRVLEKSSPFPPRLTALIARPYGR